MSLSADLHLNNRNAELEIKPLYSDNIDNTWILNLSNDEGGRVTVYLTPEQVHALYFTIGDAVLRYHEGKKILEINV